MRHGNVTVDNVAGLFFAGDTEAESGDATSANTQADNANVLALAP